VLCFVAFTTRFEESPNSFRDLAFGCIDKSRTGIVESTEINFSGFGAARVAGRGRFEDLREWHLNKLATNPRLQNNHRRLPIRAQVHDVLDAAFMPLLVFFKGAAAEFVRMIVNELVTLRAQQHQVSDVVNVRRPATIFSPWSALPKCDDVRHLREIAFGQGQMVPEQIPIATVKLAATTRPHKKQQLLQPRNRSCQNYGWRNGARRTDRTPTR
jgi:hypothetical protein